MNARNSSSWKLAALFCLGVALSETCGAESLKRQLQNLAQEHQFLLEGLDRLSREPGKPVAGEVREQVQDLLANYNYVLIQGKGGRIERVSITSLKDPNAKPRSSPVVATTRYGSHHQVAASVIGPGGQPMEVTLLVDTGATTLVLPESMIEPLGFDKSSLRPAVSQTASDTVSIRIGTLPSVQVGQVVAENVDVSFFPDQRLNGAQLLGMSFLSRFRFSLDDENNELTLIAK